MYINKSYTSYNKIEDLLQLRFYRDSEKFLVVAKNSEKAFYKCCFYHFNKKTSHLNNKLHQFKTGVI